MTNTFSIHKIIATATIVIALIFPLAVNAQQNAQIAQDELHAAIWASLLADPRTANIPPEQMQALVDALAVKAVAQNMTAEDITKGSTMGSTTATPVAAQHVVCQKGIMGYLCAFNQAFGFAGDTYIVPLMLLVTSGLLIVVIWEMIIHHRRKLMAMKASAPPWENMPK